MHFHKTIQILVSVKPSKMHWKAGLDSLLFGFVFFFHEWHSDIGQAKMLLLSTVCRVFLHKGDFGFFFFKVYIYLVIYNYQ